MDTPTETPFTLDTDPRPLFAAAASTAADVILAVRPDQLDNPTPCGDYTVREVLADIVSVLPRIAVMGRNADPMAVGNDVVAVADDAWLKTWLEAARRRRSRVA